MNKFTFIFIVVASMLSAPATFSSENPLTWKELKGLDEKGQLPKETEKKIASDVKIRGFMMPLDYSAKKISEFLLMPYIPTCMHVPTPPANQIVLVKMKKGKEVSPSFYPIEVKGKVQIKESKDFESSYSMTGLSILELDEEQQAELESNMPAHSTPEG